MSDGVVTERTRVVVRVSPPPVPVTVTLVIPVAAVLDAVRVSVLLVPVVDAGLNAAVTPLGNPPALKATAEEKPPLRVIVIALVPLAPRDRKSTRLNSSHLGISYAVFCLKKKTARHHRGAAGGAADAVRHPARVAEMHRDLRRRHLQHLGADLRECGRKPLAQGGRSRREG